MHKLLPLLCFAACQSTSPPPGGLIPGALSLAVGRAAQSSQVGVAPSDPNSLFISVEVTLADGTDQPAPLAGALFQLATSDGLIVYGDPATAFHPRGCQQTAAVASGATVSCVTVFRVAPSAVPTRLTYQRQDGASAFADVSDFTQCQKCGGACVDVSGDDADNCGGCGVQVGLGTCVNGLPVCSSSASVCNGSCVDLQKDPNNCGACGVRAASGTSCDGGTVTCPNDSFGEPQMVCGGSCVSSIDPNNCGGCGRHCGNICSDDPMDGIYCDLSSTSRVPCTTVCGSLTCQKARPEYMCPDGSLLQFNSKSNCATPPPATSLDPGGSGMTCTFVTSDCECV